MKLALITSAAVALVAAVGTSMGNPLNLVGGIPDVSAGFVLITFNATTGFFSATGATQNISLPGPSQEPAGQREFTLTCTISGAGVASNGSLTVKTDHNSPDSVAFSSTDLTAFGFGPTNKFEFVFSQAAGNLAPIGSDIGVILVGPGFPFPGGVPEFGSDFSNALFPGAAFGDGNADTFLIPAPSVACVGAVALLFGGRRRRTR